MPSAKSYMETTEGENWASNLISHLNSRFPKTFDTNKVSVLVLTCNLNWYYNVGDYFVVWNVDVTT